MICTEEMKHDKELFANAVIEAFSKDCSVLPNSLIWYECRRLEGDVVIRLIGVSGLWSTYAVRERHVAVNVFDDEVSRFVNIRNRCECAELNIPIKR
jgi:hypothetical protein